MKIGLFAIPKGLGMMKIAMFAIPKGLGALKDLNINKLKYLETYKLINLKT
ncbi:hypothetical protein LJC21_01875 [Bacteroides sp. OttesenSCG-928-E20]|nr:hypothetical protein [Bacteroides sp. OttesenSCG-928-E20]MDL2305327.1 hypothetical protein [Bacteroides sp. OttesenSCG-928-D19]